MMGFPYRIFNRALQAGIEYYDQTEEELREGRRNVFNKWSHALFGIEEYPNLIPYDGESSNIVFDGLYHGENTEAVVQLNQQYAESEYVDTDEVVSAEYSGDEWTFRTHKDHELGGRLPAYQ
jgi:hypothetical protein